MSAFTQSILFPILVLLSLTVSASENPGEFCDGNDQCTPKMHALTEEFNKGNADFASESISAFSGGCYHISGLYDSEHEHHGAFVFERRGDDLFTKGSFFFFYEQDPFWGMDVLDMNKWFDERNAASTKTLVSPDQVELQYLGTGSDYHYWFRSSKTSDKVIMIAKQKSENYSGLIFCELKRH